MDTPAVDALLSYYRFSRLLKSFLATVQSPPQARTDAYYVYIPIEKEQNPLTFFFLCWKKEIKKKKKKKERVIILPVARGAVKHRNSTILIIFARCSVTAVVLSNSCGSQPTLTSAGNRIGRSLSGGVTLYNLKFELWISEAKSVLIKGLPSLVK